MKPQEIEVDLGIIGKATLENVEHEHRYVEVHNYKVLYCGYTTGLRIFVVDGGFIPYILDDTLIIPVCNIENYNEIIFKNTPQTVEIVVQ